MTYTVIPSSLATHFPNSSAIQNNNLLSQSGLSSALSVAMAPSRTEKGKKKSQSSAGPPPTVEPVVARSLVLN